MTRLDSLTGLRFVAAFYVCAYHSTHGATPFGWMNDIHSAGYVAVSLFFILSGYVLAHSYAATISSGKFDGKDFLVKRMARIAPLHWLAIACFLGIGLVTSGPMPSVFQTLGNLLFLSTWLRLGEINMPAWSLTCEAFFYLLFARIARTALRLDDRQVLLACMACVAASILASTVGLIIADPGFLLVEWFPLARLPEFALGVFAWRFAQGRYARFAPPTACVGVGLAVSLVVLANSSSITRYFLHNSVLLVPFTFVIYGLARGGGGPLQKFLSSKVMVVLGEASFALYLLQTLVADVVARTFPALGIDFLPLGAVWRVLLIGLSLVVFRYYETPARQFLTRTFARREPPREDVALPPAA